MIAHIILNVSDFSRAEEFYDRLLSRIGFSANHREETEDFAIKSYLSNEHNLWIRCDRKAVHQPFVRDIGLDHIAFKANSIFEVDSIFNELRDAGTIITRAPAAYPDYTPEYYAFYFRDPDGIPLEIAYY